MSVGELISPDYANVPGVEMYTRQSVIGDMMAVAPAGQSSLDTETRARLSTLTQRLKEVAGFEAVADYNRYVNTADRELPLDQRALEQQLAGKTIMVTGGSGLIGTALLRQLRHYHPGRLLAFDFAAAAEAVEDVEYFDIDIRDKAGLESLMQRSGIDIIYHLAADKYNADAEKRARHTMTSNIIGTWNVLEVARANDVEQIIYASTGKATRPYSPDVYASTKIQGEWLLASAAERGDALYSGVRFTHVVNKSNVIAQFNKSIRAGEPVRVHDPESWIYVQSAKESAQLLLQAGLEAEPGTFKLCALNNLDEPVNVANLALGTTITARSNAPLYFCGVEAGYEERAWPGLYDPADAGDRSPLINSLEAPQARASSSNPAVDVFPLRFATNPEAESSFANFAKALQTPESPTALTGHQDSIKSLSQGLSWKILEANLTGLPAASLDRAARRVEQRSKHVSADQTNPDHLKVDSMIARIARERKIRTIGEYSLSSTVESTANPGVNAAAMV